ncbi:MAG: hypothetical protein Q8P36_02760 [bacterium]|nr:hypothetical protein [bacterium]
MLDSLNLLPAGRIRARLWRYISRLGTVATYLALALVVVAGILLIPTFVFLQNAETTKQARLASIESVLSSSDEAALAARLSALSRDAAILASLATTPSAIDLIRQALAVRRSGITLSGITYAPTKGSRSSTLMLSGTAASRNGLRAYQLALAITPEFANADLPVSSYAKDSDIPFTITITLVKPMSP